MAQTFSRAQGAGDHGRRGKQGDTRVALQPIKQKLRAERLFYHLVTAVKNMRQAVLTGTVRQRRQMQHGVTRHDVIDVSAVMQAHAQQIAVRQHGAFGHASSTAGVKQPGQIIGLHVHASHRRVAQHGLVSVIIH